VAHFDDEQAAWSEVTWRFSKDAPDEVKPVEPACQREDRLLAVLRRELAHRRLAHVRRIRDDYVVTVAAQLRIEIGLNERDA